MPWKDVTTVSQRAERVRLYLDGAAPMATLCHRFGVSRKTADKWVDRYRTGGLDALMDHSRRPSTSPHQTPAAQEAQVLALADQHPTWGGKKLHHALSDTGMDPVPAPSTITRILRRAGRLRTTPVEPRSYCRFERAVPNELWQIDFKGWHRMRTGTVHPLSIVDAHSRDLLVLRATEAQTHAAIQPMLTACFRTYGLPWEILADNGPPWGTSEPHASTGMDIWLMQLGIVPIHGRPLHPQTQGKIERFHRTLKADVFAGRTFVDLAEPQQALNHFRQVYHHQRPHESVGNRPPGTAYALSPRPFPETIPGPEYADDAQVRIVAPKGTIRSQRRRMPVGRGFAGMRVGVYPTDTDGIVRIQFYATTIKEVNLHTSMPT